MSLSSSTLAPILHPHYDERAIEYYSSNPIIKQGNVAVKYVNRSLNKGLFSEVECCRGDILFVEQPLLSMQHRSNRNSLHACDMCLKSIGTLREQWQRCLDQSALSSDDHDHDISDLIDKSRLDDEKNEPYQLPQTLPFTQRHSSSSSSSTSLSSTQTNEPFFDLSRYDVTPVPCNNACSERYCSIECRDLAWQQHHQLLCPNQASSSQSQSERASMFQSFYEWADENNEIFHLVLKLIANVILRDNLYEYTMFTSSIWWEQARPPPELSPADSARFVATLHSMCGEAVALMEGLFDSQTLNKHKDLFTTEQIGRFVTIFEMNQLGLFAPSPISTYIAFYHSLDEHHQEQFKRAFNHRTFIDTNLISDLRIEGMGLFTIACCANHSCEPNFSLVKRDNEDEADGFVDLDSKMALMALRDVQQGEQVFISYIDEDASLAERTELLAEYGFVCQCAKCQRERLHGDDVSDGDSSLDEFEDDDEEMGTMDDAAENDDQDEDD